MTTEIYNLQKNQPVVWYHQDPTKSNKYCLYCGSVVGKGAETDSNKEHLIGRKFVPKGKFDEGKEFNFIFRSCRKCNQNKAKLERHVSSVTIFNSSARLKDADVNKVAIRKGNKDYHPDKTGTLIKNSDDKFEFSFGKFIRLDAISPPQFNQDYVSELASYHIQGLFSLITSKNPSIAIGTRLLRRDYISTFNFYHKQDWGNQQLLEISKRVIKWDCPARLVTADGFFKAILKINRNDQDWFWALEWNKYLRVIGSISISKTGLNIFDRLPQLEWKYLNKSDNQIFRYREDIPLTNEDYLFAVVAE